MVIFNSYVKLPEGIMSEFALPQNRVVGWFHQYAVCDGDRTNLDRYGISVRTPLIGWSIKAGWWGLIIYKVVTLW